MQKIINWAKSKVWGVVTATLIAVLAFSLGVNATYQPATNSAVVTIGYAYDALAAGTVDYTYNGTNDNIPFQAALNALPVTGGRIVDVSGVTKHFSAMVTRAIGNVTIEGTGKGSLFANNGVAVIFQPGGNNWVFKDCAFDSLNGINQGVTTGWIEENVWLGTLHYAFRSVDGETVAGSFTSTNGTFTQLTATTANITTLNAPTGRGATYVIAAADAPANVKAQADVIVSGNASDEIQTAINALTVSESPYGHSGLIQLTEGTFNISSSLVPGKYTNIQGVGWSTVLFLVAPVNMFENTGGSNITYARFSDMTLYGNDLGAACAFNLTGTASNVNPDVYFERLLIAHFDGGDGIRITNHYGWNLRILNNVIEGVVNGIYIESSGTKPINVFITGNELKLNDIGAYINGNNAWVDSVIFEGNIVANNNQYGAFFRQIDGAIINGNIFRDNSAGSPNTYDGLIIYSITNILRKPYVITSNIFAGASQKYGLNLFGSSAARRWSVLVEGNSFFSNNTSSIGQSNTAGSIADGLFIIRGNQGYVTENSGNFTILAGQWGVSFAHGLATNATAVQFTLTSNCTTTVYAPFSSFTSTNITANLTALQGSDITGTWRAVIGAGN